MAITRKALRRAYIDFAIEFEPNTFVTLVLNREASSEKLSKLVGQFAARMDSFALGSVWAKAPRCQRADGIFFLEHTASNIHAHGLVHFPYLHRWQLKAIGGSVWQKLCPSGSVQLDDVHFPRGAAVYSTKEMPRFDYRQEQIVLLSDFMSDTSRAA